MYISIAVHAVVVNKVLLLLLYRQYSFKEFLHLIFNKA
jgi:hypothetical protein